MAIEITTPFDFYNNTSGSPLDSGYIYIGAENLNPETNPISIYWDAAMTIPASNPLRTISGYPARNGSPARIYCGAQYSITVKDKNGALVYSALSGNLGSVVSYVDTVANLATLDNTNTASGTVIVKDLDRGGTFIWSDTGTANGGTVFAGATGCWIRQYHGKANVKWFGAKGDGVTNDTSAIQSVFNLGLDMYVPKGVYLVHGLNNSFSNGAFTYNLYMEQEAYFKATSGTAGYVLQIDGTGGPDENGIKFQANYISIDGNAKQYSLTGLVLKRLTRARIGLINVYNVLGIGIDINETVKETTFDTIRTYRCGSTTGVTNFKPALSITSTDPLATDATNNIDIGVFYGIYNYGADIYIDANATSPAYPRKIRINNFFIHGNITTSDAVYPLTSEERDNRYQLCIGASSDIVFGTGILTYGANNVPHVRIASLLGGTTSSNSVTFDNLYIGERFSNSDTVQTHNHGITHEVGNLFIKQMKATTSFTGYYVINSIGGVCKVNHNLISYNSGSLRIPSSHNTYSPTLTGVTNIATVTKAADFVYTIGGDGVVDVIGYIQIDTSQADTTATFTKLTISLPMGVLTTNQHLVGTIHNTTESVNSPSGFIKADATNELAVVGYTSISPASLPFVVRFSYVAQLI